MSSGDEPKEEGSASEPPPAPGGGDTADAGGDAAATVSGETETAEGGEEPAGAEAEDGAAASAPADDAEGGVSAAAASAEDDQAALEERKREKADTLTKKMQKLALERQKESKDERLKVIQADQDSHLSSAKTFQELDLPKHLLDAIFEMGFERPSAIQEEALPRILAEPPRNLIGQAQSGSGKTAAFVLGMLYRTEVDEPASAQALCVTPTRELAVQIVQKAVAPMAAHMSGLKVQLALAGEHIERGKKVDAHIIVGTPGKIVDWLKKKIIDTRNLRVFVLDEADNMVAESGFRANSLLIKKMMPKRCQSLFFSATFPQEVVQFASKLVYNPDKILIERGPEFLVSLGVMSALCFVPALGFLSCPTANFFIAPCLYPPRRIHPAKFRLKGLGRY